MTLNDVVMSSSHLFGSGLAILWVTEVCNVPIGSDSHLQSGLHGRLAVQVWHSMSLLYITTAQTAAWPDATLLCHGFARSRLMLEPVLD